MLKASQHIKYLQATLIMLPVLFFALPSFAQTRDTTLQEVRVRAKHQRSSDTRLNDFAPGQKVQTIDSATLQQYQLQNMADLLSQQVPVFIKSYGFNGLATLNFRGSSAAQSQVLWNGVPIQNAALGMADVATLPVLFINKVNIVYGGSAALWGSGNVGGALLLESDAPVFDSGRRSLALSAGAGSFSQYTGGIKGTVSGKRWYLSATAYTQTAINNFEYTTAAGAKSYMPNSHLQNDAAMVQLAYKIRPQNTIGLSAWYQAYDRELPPALFESASYKDQLNRSLRLLANWDKRAGSNTWYARSSLVRDELDYSDKAVALNTNNTAYQYYQEVGWKKQMGSHSQLLLFAPIQLLWIELPETHETKHQDRIALAVAYNYKQFNNRLDAALNARIETINSQGIFLPGASAAFALRPWLQLRVNAQRSYRAPTLNELYYNPGGNAGLKPEQGWSEDAGYSVKLKAGRLSFYHDLSVYNRDIQDWIIWLGGAIWTPHNIAKVHSRGIETDNKVTYATGHWTLHISVNTAYVLATTTQSYIPADGSIGMQIPYVPRYNGRLNAGGSYKQLSLSYIHTYTGYRFITTDESEYLLPYQTGNVQLMYDTHINHKAMQLSAQCNNIWNEHYVVAGYRPMPSINWLAGVKIVL